MTGVLLLAAVLLLAGLLAPHHDDHDGWTR